MSEQSEWLEDSDPGQEYGTTWACMKCGHSLHLPYVWNPLNMKWQYCPWCGRKMDKRQEKQKRPAVCYLGGPCCEKCEASCPYR